MERIKPFETPLYSAYWYKFKGTDEIENIQWIEYFKYSEIGKEYFLLVKKDGNLLVMSNTEMEQRTNRPILRIAKGDVLMIGLGINLINDKVLDLDSVTSVDTLELYDDIIDNVPTKTNVIKGDATKFKINKKYDVIWFDGFCEQNIKLLKAHLKPDGILASWEMNTE